MLIVDSLWTGLWQFSCRVHRMESVWASRVIFKTLFNGAKSFRKDTPVSTLLFTEPTVIRWRRIYAPCVTCGHFISEWTTRVATTELRWAHAQLSPRIWRKNVYFGRYSFQTSPVIIFGLSDRDCSPLQTKMKCCTRLWRASIKSRLVQW
jgi:hypothetical protein